jgi:ABC-type multidrug transport system fused ATPase/permease subunit
MTELLEISNDGLIKISNEFKRMDVDSDIYCKDITFGYKNHEKTLNNVNMTIKKNRTTALVGSSGSGKSTLLNIFLGLIRPSSGEIRVGKDLVSDSNMRLWQQSIGFVPQDVFLTDSSISENIAYGQTQDEIEKPRVEAAARLAEIHDFIIGLKEGYDTHVGERGVQLSGGQRQRIGIARALYSEPGILVFDEATSALDPVTENSIVQTLENLHNRKTVLVVTHRIESIRNADTIYVIDGGRIVSIGTYEELINGCKRFKQLASPQSNAF